jgi:hypothetical protein
VSLFSIQQTVVLLYNEHSSALSFISICLPPTGQHHWGKPSHRHNN